MNPSKSPSGLDVGEEDLLAGGGDHSATISSEDDRSLSVEGRDQVRRTEAGRSRQGRPTW